MKIGWEETYYRLEGITKELCSDCLFYGIGRGGQIIAGLTGRAVDNVDDADYIIGDISGESSMKFRLEHPNKKVLFLIDRKQKERIEFPWEESGEIEVEENVIRLLEYFGEDCKRAGLKDTPKRYVKFFDEFLRPPKFNFTTFASEGYDEMIVQSNIPFYSLCEHHIAPFFGEGFIAYIPRDRIVGLSKLARTLDKFSRRLQNQERITNQVAEYLQQELNPIGVAVVLKAKHLCMEMRGVKKHNTYTTTSKLLGAFKENEPTKNEFLNLIK